MTQINFTCEKYGKMTMEEIKFNDYINDHYANQAVEVSKALRQKIDKIKVENRFGVGVLCALRTTPRFVYIRDCNICGKADNTCDIEIDLINQTYRALNHLE